MTAALDGLMFEVIAFGGNEDAGKCLFLYAWWTFASSWED